MLQWESTQGAYRPNNVLKNCLSRVRSLTFEFYTYTRIIYIFWSPFVAQNPLANKTTDNTKLSTVAQADDTQTYATPIGGDYMPLHPSTPSWEIMREQVDILKVIGKGAFSQVAKATMKNVLGYQDCITVAVKMLKGM